jgi:phage-related protein
MRFADFRKKLDFAWVDLFSACKMGEKITLPHARTMPTVAAGVSELRVKGRDGIFRVFYCTAASRGVLVFHAFAKKTHRTPPLEIELARKRLKELLDA